MTTKDDVFDAAELDAIEDAKEAKQKRERKQQEFLDTLAEQEDAEVVQTPVTLAEGIPVEVKLKMTGEFEEIVADMERMGERLEAKESAKELPEIADRACQILADAVIDPAYDKDTFYQAYRKLGSDAIGKMLRRVFEAVEAEVERQHGNADGFRAE